MVLLGMLQLLPSSQAWHVSVFSQAPPQLISLQVINVTHDFPSNVKAGMTRVAVGVAVVFVFVVRQNRHTRAWPSRTSAVAKLVSGAVVGGLAEQRSPLVAGFVSKVLKVVDHHNADVWPKCPDEAEESLVGTLIVLLHHVRHSRKLGVFQMSCQRFDMGS